ncbi:ABC transporter substrate-binding protein [Kribbella speibonae]|uniref:Extracellular solute-binding protein n=1 Tax=Kribbella speibonae TaxID=1572660 RepID=A0A4R0IXJ9_9ACTN|nr:extracellular solute-binding protein [Kribbella speibonae]TCC36406.1 extracellular solute-binding protein [Kribbella speibonae]
MRTVRQTATALGALAVAAALLLAGCSKPATGDQQTKNVTQAEIDKAMDTPTTLTFWSWVPDLQKEVDLFEKKYPKIKVNLVNTTDSTRSYTKVRAALKAGKGAPDVTQIGYDYLGSFKQTNSLLDLSPYGGKELANDYVDWVWKQVADSKGVWAIPQDSGPLGTLYRDDIFRKAGLDGAPATWDDFAKAAAQVKSKTGSYITNLPGNDMPQIMSLFWQAGAKPFSYDGQKTVGIDLNGDTEKKVMAYWQDLIKKDLVSTDADFTDEFYQGLSRNKYASWLVAAWGPVFLQGTAKDTSGKWRAGKIPQWQPGQDVSGNWGGSSDVVLASTKNPIAAYQLAKFINHDSESTLTLANQQFLFPTNTATLQDPKFTGQASEFYGGQKVNQFFSDVSKTVDKDFEWLPFMDYANTSFNDTLGKAISEKGDLSVGLAQWQEKLVTYAKQQGFTVK